MLGTQFKEKHLLFIVCFVFTEDHSYENDTVGLPWVSKKAAAFESQWVAPAAAAKLTDLHIYAFLILFPSTVTNTI